MDVAESAPGGPPGLREGGGDTGDDPGRAAATSVSSTPAAAGSSGSRPTGEAEPPQPPLLFEATSRPTDDEIIAQENLIRCVAAVPRAAQPCWPHSAGLGGRPGH